ncbi:MAG: HU family DNA-binding protein [Treponema sp.]
MDIVKETKSSLVEKIHAKTDYKLMDIKKIVDMLFDETEASLAKGVPVEFRGFGVFSVSIRKAHKNVRNPRTGEVINMKDTPVVRFKVGKNLKDTVKKAK